MRQSTPSYLDTALLCWFAAGDTSMAQAIVNAVSKMAAMFSTMLAAPSAADAPSLALLRHNDLHYLANHLLVVPFLFGSELKDLLGAYAWLGDDALRLRNTARAAFIDTVSTVMRQCRVSVERAAYSSAGGVHRSLHWLSSSCTPLLPHSLLLVVACAS